MTYTYYIYKGTNEDFLNLGGPHPKERTLEQAYQISFETYLGIIQSESLISNKVTAENPWIALEMIKKYHRENFSTAFTPAVLIIANQNKLLCSYQHGFNKVRAHSVDGH